MRAGCDSAASFAATAARSPQGGMEGDRARSIFIVHRRYTMNIDRNQAEARNYRLSAYWLAGVWVPGATA